MMSARLGQERQVLNILVPGPTNDPFQTEYDAKLKDYRFRLDQYYRTYGTVTPEEAEKARQNREAMEDERVRRWRAQ